MTRHARRLTMRFTLALAGAASFAVSAHAQGSKNVLAGPAVSAAPGAPRPAKALVDEAMAHAKAMHKNVLVEFGASWCGWCKRFEAFLAEPTVGKLMLDNFVVVHLVVQEVAAKKALENEGGAAMLKQMGGTGGIPYFFILDSAGKKIGDANIMPNNGNVGHPNTPEEVAAFDRLLERTAPHMSAAQRRLVWEYLTRIAKGSGA
jgi:thiol:disulfide interchange protein